MSSNGTTGNAHDETEIVHVVIRVDGSMDVYINPAFPFPEPKLVARRVEQVLTTHRARR